MSLSGCLALPDVNEARGAVGDVGGIVDSNAEPLTLGSQESPLIESTSPVGGAGSDGRGWMESASELDRVYVGLKTFNFDWT